MLYSYSTLISVYGRFDKVKNSLFSKKSVKYILLSRFVYIKRCTRLLGDSN